MNNQYVKPSRAHGLRRIGIAALALGIALASSLAGAQGNSASHVSATGAGHSRAHNVSRDLQAAINAPSVGNTRWAKDTPRGRLMQVIVVADDSSDKALNGLRKAIVQAGGSVHRKFDSVAGLSALLPAAKVAQIAARNDVLVVAPNRVVARTASLLESETGAADARSALGWSSSLDGSGVTIAVLDSGIMASHTAFLDANGNSRVVARTDVTPTAAQDWTVGTDTSIAGGSVGIAT